MLLVNKHLYRRLTVNPTQNSPITRHNAFPLTLFPLDCCCASRHGKVPTYLLPFVLLPLIKHHQYGNACLLRGTSFLSPPPPPGACPVLNGFLGQPVCLDNTSGPVPATPAISAADAQCPYLSPANFSLIQDRFKCAGYATLSSLSFSCTGPYSPVCKYAGISDFVPAVPASSSCSTIDEFTLFCNLNAPAPDSTCPPFTTFNSKTYELSAAICVTTEVRSVTTPYASLFSQFQCAIGLHPLIVNQQAGCFLIAQGASVCPFGSADCFYAVPKPDSY